MYSAREFKEDFLLNIDNIQLKKALSSDLEKRYNSCMDIYEDLRNYNKVLEDKNDTLNIET